MKLFKNFINENFRSFRPGDKVKIPTVKYTQTGGLTSHCSAVVDAKERHQNYLYISSFKYKDEVGGGGVYIVGVTDKNKSSSFYGYDLEPYDDSPEDTNYEEWVEESKGRDYTNVKVGDKLLIHDRSHIGDDWRGKIVNVIAVTPTHMKWQNWKGTTADIAFSDYKTYGEFIYDDEPEEQNYEEWLEESKKYNESDFKPIENFSELKVGDIVYVNNKHNQPPSPEMISEVTYIDDNYKYILVTYLYTNNSKFKSDVGNKGERWSTPSYVKVLGEDTEEQNYEEWNEKIITKYEKF